MREDQLDCYDWYELIDRTSGQLLEPIKETITQKAGTEIANLFLELIQIRNRIVHSFQITATDGNQKLATKYIDHRQEVITEEFLLNFIKLNEKLCLKLHDFRGY